MHTDRLHDMVFLPLSRPMISEFERQGIQSLNFFNAIKIFVRRPEARDSMIQHDGGVQGIARFEARILGQEFDRDLHIVPENR